MRKVHSPIFLDNVQHMVQNIVGRTWGGAGCGLRRVTMARRVTQERIADRLGLDRTTVTKILNRDPKYSANSKTKKRVFATAEKLGYDFTSIRRPFRREYGRTVINARSHVTILLKNGRVFDEGRCLVRNISVGGALLSKLRLKKMVLPLANFTIALRISGERSIKDLKGECEIVRLAATDTGEPELGVKFVNLTDAGRRHLKRFVAKRIRGAS